MSRFPRNVSREFSLCKKRQLRVTLMEITKMSQLTKTFLDSPDQQQANLLTFTIFTQVTVYTIDFLTPPTVVILIVENPAAISACSVPGRTCLRTREDGAGSRLASEFPTVRPQLPLVSFAQRSPTSRQLLELSLFEIERQLTATEARWLLDSAWIPTVFLPCSAGCK